MPSSRGSSQPRVIPWVSHTAGWFFTVWATKEAQLAVQDSPNIYIMLLQQNPRWTTSKTDDKIIWILDELVCWTLEFTEGIKTFNLFFNK